MKQEQELFVNVSIKLFNAYLEPDFKLKLYSNDENAMVNELSNRIKFKTTLLDFLCFIGFCLCIRRAYRLDSRQNLLIKRSNKLISQDLNVVNII